MEPGWERLLVAARRSLERTGGRLDGPIGLDRPRPTPSAGSSSGSPAGTARRVPRRLTRHPGRDRRGAAPHAWRAAGGRAQPDGAAAARPARRARRRGRRARHGARRRAEPGARRRGVVRGRGGPAWPPTARSPAWSGAANRTSPRRPPPSWTACPPTGRRSPCWPRRSPATRRRCPAPRWRTWCCARSRCATTRPRPPARRPAGRCGTAPGWSSTTWPARCWC